MTYGYLATMKARPGRRDDVVAILLRGSEGLRAAGCRLYAVGVSDGDPDGIWVSELWGSKAEHEDSLTLPQSKAAIAEALPMLTGEFGGQELTVVGGLGVLPE